jgi:energy-coupling factor transporter ATP-binding protein EcfA2
VEKIKITDVFTPTTPAKYAFVERQGLNDQLVEALMTPGKQVVVYGPSGSGKTTLLVNKLDQLYPDHITTRCTAATTFEALLLSAFDSLDVYYSSTASIKKSHAISAKLEKEYLGIKSSIEATSASESQVSLSRMIPPQLTAQRLAEFCGAAGCCWVLEDFHKIPQSEKVKTSQVMKVFMDTAADFRDVKIVAIGAVDSAREVVQYDPEMRNRVAEIAVPLMNEAESVEVLTKGEELLNLHFGSIKYEIASYSSGLAAVCHQLGLNICFAANIMETAEGKITIDSTQFRKALERYLNDASDTLKAVFDLALKQERKRTFDNTRLILQALTELGHQGGSHADVLKSIRNEEPNYPASNLTSYLHDLRSSKRGGILRFDPTSGKYFFSDPLYLAYAQCLLTPASSLSQRMIRILRYNLDVGILLKGDSKQMYFVGHGVRRPSSGIDTDIAAPQQSVDDTSEDRNGDAK